MTWYPNLKRDFEVRKKGIMSEHELLTVDDLAERLKVKPSWIYLHANELRAMRLGKYLRFRWDLVLKSLDEQSSRRLQSPATLPK